MGRRARTAPEPGRIPAGSRPARNALRNKSTSRPVGFHYRLFLCTDISNRERQLIPSLDFLAPSGDGSPPRVDKSRFQVHFNRGLDSPCGGATSRGRGEQPRPLSLLLSSFLAQDSKMLLGPGTKSSRAQEQNALGSPGLFRRGFLQKNTCPRIKI